MTSDPNLTVAGFGGAAVSGTVGGSSTAPVWIRYTFPRPTVRAAADGLQPLLIREVSAVCAGNGAPRTMFAAVSTAGGWASESLRVTVAAARAAGSEVLFQGLQLPVLTGGQDGLLQLWLVADGPFYFDRYPSDADPDGIEVDNGNVFTGAPVGTLGYLQLPGPPNAAAVLRDPVDPARATLSWRPPVDGVASLGYRVQVAEDERFTVGLREAVTSRQDYRWSGLDPQVGYSFRVTARNEVSERFQQPGGDWSAPVAVEPVVLGGPNTDDTGSPAVAAGGI